MWEDIYQTEGKDLRLPISQIKMDEFYLETMQIDLVAGRAFHENSTADHRSVIINETTSELFGWTPENSLGKRIKGAGDDPSFEVVGVVQDFHVQSLHQPISPVMFTHIHSDYWGDQRVLAIKFDVDDGRTVLSELESKWHQFTADAPFQFSFYDDELRHLYDQEYQLGSLISIFSVFSIVITLVGLFGLISYSVERKQKEIGIRKVLGASGFQIFWRMNWEYLKVLIVSFLVITPVVWWQISQWLQTFTYHITISPLLFFTAGFLVFILALVSVSTLSAKAARLNPVTAISNE